MQYLRMLTNALLGGALVGAYVTLLVLQLNPAVQLGAPGIAPLILTWWAYYGIHATVFFYVLIVIKQVVAVEVRSPGWLSLRTLAGFATIALATSALVSGLNLRGFSAVIGPDAADRMTSGVEAQAACALLCIGIAFAQTRLERGRRVAAVLFAAVLVASLALPLAFRGAGAPPKSTPIAVTTGISPTPSTSRVSLILLDGASMDFLAPAAASGRVPNFGRLLESGAIVHLATLRPTQPAPVWTAVATGKLPYKTSIYSAARYRVAGSAQRLDLLPDFCFAQSLFRFGLLGTEDATSAAVRARPVWELAGRFGITSGVIDWPVTYPARAGQGYLVSDEFFRRADASVLVSLDGAPSLVSPSELLDAAERARLSAAPAAASVAAIARRAAGLPLAESATSPSGPSGSLAVDAAAERIASDLGVSWPVQFTAVRFPGIDTVGHYYLRYAVPRAFGDVTDDERNRYGRVLEDYYTYIDGIVGRAMTSLGPHDLLLVVSGFGMEPLGLGKRLLERAAGDAELSGSHEGAPDGFLLAYGGDVARGLFPRGSVVDIAPTVLYFLGLPIARDMDGFARTDILVPAFTAERPITFIPFYDR